MLRVTPHSHNTPIMSWLQSMVLPAIYEKTSPWINTSQNSNLLILNRHSGRASNLKALNKREQAERSYTIPNMRLTVTQNASLPMVHFHECNNLISTLFSDYNCPTNLILSKILAHSTIKIGYPLALGMSFQVDSHWKISINLERFSPT